jgi:hypothetical protein
MYQNSKQEDMSSRLIHFFSQINICLIMYFMYLFLMYIVLIVHVISVPL